MSSLAQKTVDGSALRAAFNKIAQEEGETETSDNPAPSKSTEALGDLLAHMRSLSAHYQHAHWQTQGPTFYADHELFARLYESLGADIDSLAEKMVGYYGPDSLEFKSQLKTMSEMAGKYSGDNFVTALLASEEALQKRIEDIFESMEDADKLPLGLNDFLAALANSRDTAVYLLKQRSRE